MTYRSVVATRTGSADKLQVITNELRDPKKDEVRIRVEAVPVCRPDITARSGTALYSGTPLGQKTPFVPGYAVIGRIEAVGKKVTEAVVGDRVGVLTVIGGYAEVLYWRSDRLIPVPENVDAAEAATIMLNYIVAYQTLHRKAQVRHRDTILIIGASGGIGTALLQLGKLSDLKMYGIASRCKHDVVAEYGAIPIDYRSQNFVDVIQSAEPDGIDAVIDGMMRLDYINGSLSLLRHGGTVVGYGEPSSRSALARIMAKAAKNKLFPRGKRLTFYGTSTYFIGKQEPYIEDWAILFRLLAQRKIEPVITQTFPILEAAKANELLESGTVIGNVVLVAHSADGE